MAEDEGVLSQNPNLVKLLTDRLPSLGLDYETYGPYVWGVVDNTDEDELLEVIQLLQASSEDFAEDEDKWTQLTNDIEEAMKQDKELRQAQDQEHVEAERSKMEEQLAKAKLEQPAAKAPAKSQKSSGVDDATKKALMQRYAYEDDGDEAEGNAAGASSEEVQNNRQVAAQANMERSKEERSKKVLTKKEEQQKTKEQRLNKDKLKEERRKKNTKQERKR
jgi:hypothetical protein